MAIFNGQMNPNEIYSNLYNGFRYVTTFAGNLSGLANNLAEMFRVDGGMYRDQSVYTSMDILKSREWDPTNTNVLATEQKVAPVQQKITVDQKRQIGITVENYLSKRAWMDENAFSQFASVVDSQVGNTRKLYDQRLVDTLFGNMNAAMPSGKGAKQAATVTLPTAAADASQVETEATERRRVRLVGKKISEILRGIKDSTRDYNDYGFMTSYDKEDMMLVWNNAFLDEFDFVDLPAAYKDAEILPATKLGLEQKYFGRAVNTSTDCGSGKVIKANGEVDATKGNVRTLVEKTFTFEGKEITLYPGDALATGVKVSYTGGSVSNPDFTQDEVYIEDTSVICKICHKDSVKYLSSFETSTSFFNAKNLSENRYLTWLYAKPDYLRNYPFVTLKKA